MGLIEISKVMIWFTSDTHFRHANIIKYCKRPFLWEDDLRDDGDWISETIKRQRAKEMTDCLVSRWNEKISKQDTVYHLGDFTYGHDTDALKLFGKLNFKYLRIIFGNHDDAIRQLQHTRYKEQACVFFNGSFDEIKIYNQEIVLCHYALKVWNKSHHGAWHLYGHSHGTLPDDPYSLSMDVGVDTNDYYPYSFDDIKKVMSLKKFKPVDYHGQK